MPFRDDRDALREKMDQLERELSKAQDSLGRVQAEHRESSEEADELRRRLERLQAERASLSGPPRRTARPVVWAVLGALAVLLGIVYVAERSHRAREEALRVRQAEARLQETRALGEAEVRQLEDQIRKIAAQPDPLPEPPTPEPPAVDVPLGPMLELTWAAKIRRVEGSKLRRGSACEIRGALQAGVGMRANVVCGETTIYDWNEPLGSGMQMRSCSIEATMEGEAALRCSDTGPRTGRPQLSIETAAKTATVWKDGGMRVELAVATIGPRERDRVSIATGTTEGATAFNLIVRAGRVTKVSGDAGVRRGETCAVVVSPGEPPHDCRASVRCGDRNLYGGGTSGFLDCEQMNGSPTTLTDGNPSSHGGDPMITIDLPRNHAVVSEAAPDWSVTISLSPP